MILMVTLTIQVQQLFTAVVLASAATDFLYLGVHNCFAIGSAVLSVLVHSSSVTEVLT